MLKLVLCMLGLSIDCIHHSAEVTSDMTAIVDAVYFLVCSAA